MSEQKTEKKDRRTVMGRTLTALRKAHKLTQEQVADILKIKRSTYAYYERDITPTLENIKKLSVLFNSTVHFLMYGKEEDSFSYGPIVEDPNAPGGNVPIKSIDLKKDEALLLAHYRLLSAQNKEKAYKEVKELFDKED